MRPKKRIKETPRKKISQNGCTFAAEIKKNKAMPANKNTVTRYYILDKLLANRYHNYSTEDLLRLVNEELVEIGQKPVTRRTIELDLHYLEYDGPFLVEIDHYQIDDVSQRTNKTVKKSCHRYLDPSFSIFKKEMTEDEKYLLNEALTLLGQFDGLPNLEGLEALRKSLEVRTKRQIISFTKNPLENSNLLGELFTAISQQQVIQLHYHQFEDPEEDNQFIAYPYQLKEHNRRWYLVAAVKNEDKLWTFPLERIDRFEPIPSMDYIPYNGDINERFEDIIGISLYNDRTPRTIVFWVSDKSKDYVLTKPLHESQRNYRGEREKKLRCKYPNLEGGRFFSINCLST